VTVDPTRALPAQARRLVAHPPAEDTDLRADSGIIVGSVLRIPVGRYRVEAFHSREYDTMGLRLRLLGR
jgi:hypothetical protein